MKIIREPSVEDQNIIFQGICGWCLAHVEAWRVEVTVERTEKEREVGYAQCPCCDTGMKFFPR